MVPYATRRALTQALDVSSARNDQQIDRVLDSGSRAVDSLCHRVFYPWTGTRTFDWPNPQTAPHGTLWLDAQQLITLTAVSSGGTTIPVGSVLLRPDTGPPYSRIELDRSASVAFGGGATPQRSISLTGVWGYDLTEAAAGALAVGVSSPVTTWPVSDSSAIGPGSLLRVDSERVLVTEASMVTTGLTLAGIGLAASAANVTATISGAGLVAGEVILIDSERMLITDLVGTAATVKRAWDGSVLAAHTVGTVIAAPRSLTVTRGALGTTAAAHNSAATIVRHVYPAPVVSLTLAYAISELIAESSGYTVTRGPEGSSTHLDQRGIKTLEDRVYTTYGRKARKRVI